MHDSLYTVNHRFVCSFAVAISSNGSLQLASAGSEGMQSLQTLTMTNSNPNQPTILQYAQTADGQQILLPSNQVVLQGWHSKSKRAFHLAIRSYCCLVTHGTHSGCDAVL